MGAGWAWVVVLRDATALAFLGASAFSELVGGGVGWVALLGCTFVFGPVLTVGVLWAKRTLRVFEALRQRLSRGSAPAGLHRRGEAPFLL